MRKAFKIVLATGVILGLAWISVALAAVFVLVILVNVVLARGGRSLTDNGIDDDFGMYVGGPHEADARNITWRHQRVHKRDE